MNAGLAGLALTSAMMLTGVMNFLVRQTSELEINMNAVERILEYVCRARRLAIMERLGCNLLVAAVGIRTRMKKQTRSYKATARQSPGLREG